MASMWFQGSLCTAAMTYRSVSIHPMSSLFAPAVICPTLSSSWRSISLSNRSADCRTILLKRSSCWMPARARSLAAVADGGDSIEDGSILDDGSIVTTDEVEVHKHLKLPERDFTGTPYVPVYVMLPLCSINMDCELVDADGLLEQLKVLKSVDVDGVMVDCWWGIVEANAPQQYRWSGYKQLFQIVRNLDLKLQVVLSFHECGSNVGDDVHIPLPHWVTEIGQSNPDIYFTDREGRRNTECLSWGIDKERILRGRTAVEWNFNSYFIWTLEHEWHKVEEVWATKIKEFYYDLYHSHKVEAYLKFLEIVQHWLMSKGKSENSNIVFKSLK